MNLKSLKPASQLSGRFGVKALVYGPPGCGKTPVFNTAPRPVLMVVEPGMLSMRNSNVPSFEAYTYAAINEFCTWLFASAETKNFDTVGIDSISQLAEIILTHKLGINKDPRKAYGEMSREVMAIVNALYYMPQKHVYLIGKQTIIDEGGAMKRKPYFPGQDLNVKIPHMYDEILHMGLATIPGVAGQQMAFRTRESFDIMARDRSGMLNEYEQPDLTALFTKAMT